jgi:hypothetical protein
MYLAVLTIHNVLRWFVILFGLMAAIGGFVGWLGKRPWGRGDNRAGMLFTMVLDLQFLAGAVLYFVLSPITRGALGNMAGAIFGAVFITGLNEILRYTTDLLMNMGVFSEMGINLAPLREFVFGLAIVLFILLEPRGLAELWRIVRSSFRLWPFSY